MNNYRKILTLLFFLCIVPRVAYLVVSFDGTGYEQSIYWRISGSMLDFGTFGFKGGSTTTQDFLYPFFLAATRIIAGNSIVIIYIVQIVIAAIGAVYLFMLSNLLTNNVRVSFISSLLYCLYPYVIRQSVAIIEVPLFMTLLIASLYYFYRLCYKPSVRLAAISGVVLSLCFLSRTMIFPVFILFVLFSVKRVGVSKILVLVFLFFLVAGPFCMRNYHLDGSLLPTRSGLNLFKGNCKYTSQIVPEYSVDFLGQYIMAELRKGDLIDDFEVYQREQDEYLKRLAIDYMMANPVETFKRKILNIIYLFHYRVVPFYPLTWDTDVKINDNNISITNTMERPWYVELSYSVFFVFLLLTCFLGIYLRRRLFKNDCYLYFIVAGFIIVYSIYWPATRLRVPMDFVLMFFSAVTCDFVITKIKGLRVS